MRLYPLRLAPLTRRDPTHAQARVLFAAPGLSRTSLHSLDDRSVSDQGYFVPAGGAYPGVIARRRSPSPCLSALHAAWRAALR
jgi:hypothetical protein